MVKPVLMDAMDVTGDGSELDDYALAVLGDDGCIYLAVEANVDSLEFDEKLKFEKVNLEQKITIDPKYIQSSKLKITYIIGELYLFVVAPININEAKLYEIYEQGPNNWKIKTHDIKHMTFCIEIVEERVIVGGKDGVELINIVTGARRSISSKDVGIVLSLHCNLTPFFSSIICYAGTTAGLLMFAVDGGVADVFINSGDSANKLIPGGIGKINTVYDGGKARVIMLQENGISRFVMDDDAPFGANYTWGEPIYNTNPVLAGKYLYSADSLSQDMADIRVAYPELEGNDNLEFYLIDANDYSVTYYAVNMDDISSPNVGHETYVKNDYYNVVGNVKPILRYITHSNRIFILSPDQQLSVGVDVELIVSHAKQKWHKIDF